MSTENANTPQAADEASTWYADLRASNIRNIDARLEELASGHSALENTWNELNQRQEDGLASDDMRTVLETERERARLLQEAQQLQNGYAALQNERQRLEQHADPRFEELIANSSAPSQMFLRVHRHKLENDPAALKQLMFADARAKAAGLKPDSNHYFRSLEAAVGLDASDRNLDDFKGEFDENTNTYRQERKQAAKPEAQATEAQKIMARNLPGVDEQEYLAQIANPFSQAAQTVSLEPDELNFGQSKAMEVSLDETPKKAPARYKSPDPKTSVNLSPAELGIIENMAAQTNRPLAEVRTEFAKQKLALHGGKTSHMLYEDRLKAMGHR